MGQFEIFTLENIEIAAHNDDMDTNLKEFMLDGSCRVKYYILLIIITLCIFLFIGLT